MDRRESLGLIAGAIAGLAGCNGIASDASGTSPTASGEEGIAADGPASGATTDPEVELLRVDSDRQPVWLADEDGDGRATPRPRERHIDSVVVDGPSRSDRLSVGEGVDGAAVESFLSATDFDAETVYVETIRVEECFELALCRISWHSDEVATDYAQRIRPYDEACAVDEWVFEARLVRIPDAIDAERITGGSTSVGTGACDADGARAAATGEGGAVTSRSADADGGPTPRTNATTGGGQ